MDKKDLIYGTRAVIEAIHAGRDIERVLIQAGLNNELIYELTQLLKERQLPYTFVPQQKLSRFTTKNHQGVICFLAAVGYASLDAIVHQVYEAGRDPFLLILDRITDVRNFGAIARTAECLGVDALVIPEKGNAPLSSDAMKTSAGALSYLPICREKDLKKTVRFLQESGIRVIGCTEKTDKEIYQIHISGPVALIVGSEEDGISDILLRACDDLARIPMKGRIGSLNVSVAAGMALYEIIRQKATVEQ